MSKTEEIASTLLGKKVDGSEFYDPSLLVAVPRYENREQYNIDENNLPFEGYDVWHAYEFSAMTENGIPVTRLMKVRYSCNNKYIVESKSFKLYLNSYNMSRYGKTIEDCLDICKKSIENDLSNKLETNVEVNFLDNNCEKSKIYSNFTNILDLVDKNNIVADKFKEAPELLETEETEDTKEYYLMFDSLRSNCRVTHQPDWADSFIYYKSKKHIKEDSLLKYLISFRNEWHFHEEANEMIFKRLYDILDENDQLFVNSCFTRRGGLDIWPARWTPNCKVEDVFKVIDLNCYARCGNKQ